MLETVRERRVIPPALDIEAISVPALDPADLSAPPVGSADLAQIGGVGCVITYVDAGGGRSVRRVTCRTLSQVRDVRYLQAFCHERVAVRSFRLDRIVDVACGVTGEVFEPATLFFDRFDVSARPGHETVFGLDAELATDLRACLNVLVFLGRADGRLVPQEARLIDEFCTVFGVRYAGERYADQDVRQHARLLAPDADIFFAALDRIKRANAPLGLARLVLQSAARLIDADGIHHPREFELAAELQDYLSS